ncbi:MAG TPA: hypothetical protein VG406_26705 [Isosphaeraceae bacterium]|jgi:hypothetical protein|nr:hypothetical protein [Isosphaeraceae bacterium]
MGDLLFNLLFLPFRLLWLAFQADFGLLETPEPPPPDPAAQPTAVWDRELDGADGPA